MTNSHRRQPNMSAALMLGLGLALGISCQAAAQPVTATWAGGASGSWFAPTNWSTNPVVPNNGTPTNAEYTVAINTPAAVTIDTAPVTVDSVSLGVAGSSLAINTALTATSADGNSAVNFSSGTTVLNNGTLTAPAGLAVGPGASLVMGAGSQTIGFSSGGAARLYNYGTISGQGAVGQANASVVFANAGLVNANVSGQTLTLYLANSSSLGGANEASNGGTLAMVDNGLADSAGSGTFIAQGGGTLIAAGIQTNIQGSLIGGFSAAGTGSKIVIPGASVTAITDTISLDGGGSIVDQNGLDVLRNLSTIQGGTLQLSNGHNLTLPSSLVCSSGGTLRLNGATTLTVQSSYYDNGGGGVVSTSSGTILTDSGSTLTVTGSNPQATFRALLMGNGVVNSNVSLAGGAIMPGSLGNPFAPVYTSGMLTVNGDIDMTLGNFKVVMGGPAQVSQYSLLEDDGATTLGGTLQLLLTTGFEPTPGETFTILIASGALVGAFTNAPNGGIIDDASGAPLFLVTYGPGTGFPDSVVLTFVGVPEPGSLALLGGAAGGAALWRRRKALNSQ